MKPKSSSSILRNPKLVFAQYFVLLIVVFIMAFPFFWMVITTLKPDAEVYTSEIILISRNMSFEVYIRLLTDPLLPVMRFFLNSIIISTAAMLLCVSTALLAAFPLARRRMPGKRIIFSTIIATMMVPGEVVLIGLFIVENSLGIIDTYHGIFLPLSINATIFLIIYNFIGQLPKALDEAAMIDGASLWQILIQIIAPLSKPALFSSALLAFLGAWQNFTIPYIIAQSNKMYPLAVGALFVESTLYATIRDTLALSTLLTIPTLIIFIITQRYFFSGITAGAVKG
jgi:ABC-type glycerol-3-phosphate transport system permease component